MDWGSPSPHGDRLLSRRSSPPPLRQHEQQQQQQRSVPPPPAAASSSSIFVSPGEMFGHNFEPATSARLTSCSEIHHADSPAFLIRPAGDKNMKELLPSTSFDSSEDEALPTFHERVVENEAAFENESSDSTETDRMEEFRSLYEFIGSYKPREIALGALFRPFIPDYIPAVGAVDEFIKVPRPDGLADYLGLKVLDESGSNQSDPAIISLQLRASTMQSSCQFVEVAAMEDPEKTPRKIDAWIESMKEVHRLKLPPTVTYSKPMPDMESLIKGLPIVEEPQTPNADTDMDLETLVDICCSFLGIPVYKSRIESLHCLFALFLELKKTS